MKIRGIFIEGFGVFSDFEIEGLPDGLTVFLGPNECGKSTLLAFLRGVLFGFPDARSRDNRHLPLRGGRHGGRVFLEEPPGVLTVEREAGKRRPVRLTFPDGTEGGDPDLRRILAGADAGLFRSVFAFSLSELERFETLTEEGVKDLIFSAGISGAGRSGREVMGSLEARASLLFKPRGQGRINQLAVELGRLGEEIENAKAACLGYAESLRQEEALDGQVEAISADTEALRKEERRLGRLIDLWPLWVEIRDAKAKLLEKPPIDRFPADPEERLAAAQKLVEAARKGLADLEADGAADEKQKEEIHLDDAAEAVRDRVESLHEELALHRDRLRMRPEVGARLARAQEALAAALAELGPGWDEARAAAFDGSIPRREEVREREDRLERAAAGARRAEEARERAAEGMAGEERDLERLSSSLSAPEPLPLSAIKERERAVARARSGSAELRAVDAEARSLKESLEEREESLQAAVLARPWTPPGWAAKIGSVVAVLSAAAGAALLVSGNYPGGAACLVISLLAAALALGSARLLRRTSEGSRRWEERLKALREGVERVRKDLQDLEAKRPELSGRLEEDCRTLGIPSPPSPAALEDLGLDLLDELNRRSLWEAARARIAEAGRKAEDARSELRKRTLALETAAAPEREEEAAWLKWKEDAGIPAALTPGGVIEFFETVGKCRDLVRSRDALRGEIHELEAGIGGWEGRAREVLTSAGVEGTNSGERLAEEIAALRGRCRMDRESRAALGEIVRRMEMRSARIDAAKGGLQEAGERLSLLFREAGAGDEREFRERLGTFKERQALKEKIESAEARISIQIGAGEGARALREDLQSGKLDEWKEGASALAERVKKMEGLRDELIARRQDARARRVALEESADVARLTAGREGLLAELFEAAREWKVLTLARGLIGETLKEFERTRQPAVLAEASRSFQTVTGGRYQRIVQDEKEDGLAIIDRTGGRIGIPALSRGTAEQLYLCLRLGLASEFARKAEALPVILDDVLVNFDPARARAMAAVLLEFSKGHQVFLFTCHPHTRDLLKGLDGSIRLVELSRSEPEEPPRKAGRRSPKADRGPGEAEEARGAPAKGAGVKGAAAPGIEEAIFNALKDGPLQILEIAGRTGMDQMILLRTLISLRESGYVEALDQKQGARWAWRGEAPR